jgi:hypothetical protein|tara:strand:+ start:1091 stop:1318 length:228 start_codon:yes stop_codon:yes gene_type:complete
MAKATSAPKKKLNLYTKAESVEEYLARGGVVTVCEAGARTEDIPMGQWSRNRSRVKAPTPVDEVPTVDNPPVGEK